MFLFLDICVYFEFCYFSTYDELYDVEVLNDHICTKKIEKKILAINASERNYKLDT